MPKPPTPPPSKVIRYFVIPFGKKRGELGAGQPQEARDSEMAIARARRVAETKPNTGAVAVRRTSASMEDEGGTFEIIFTVGEVNTEGLFEG